uniref:zinc finger BED domain-containing protein 1-like n=1 Tax=Epinephelus lanceolatus TaxID=310571 RepID=UPI00144634C1|nr:zinc finger BED domain-containing protein 1-like [Epinephelus lanceolatus]
MAHTINLAARKGLAERSVATTVSRLKAAAQHFKHSPTDSYLLESKQKLLGLKPVQLINDCPTLWNSTYDMICRAADQQAAVAAVIMEKKLSRLELSSVEWTLMEKVKDVLKPFKVATQALSTENYPTASAVLLLQYVLLTQLNPSTNDPAALKEMKSMISTDLKARYGPDKDAFFLLNTASYLDPRFHRLVHLEQESRQAVRDKVQRELAELSEETGGEEGQEENATATEPQQCKEKNALSAMGDLFGDVYCQNSAGVRPNEDVLQREMMAYDSEPPPPSDSNPLSWWKERSLKYPHLAQLARGYLAICGTSVRAERVFSTARNIVTKQCSSLEPENVNHLVFLANNLKKSAAR